ncbi:MAG: PorT family protein [Rikenellaceae bacterium]|nr:PorT family protein [Rikenellaceae bacterium]
MKKVLIISLAAMFTMGSTSVYGQQLSGGVKAEANLSNFIRSDLDGLDNPMRVGASVGGFMKWDVTSHFALQPEVMFHFKASKFKDETAGKSSYEYYGMEIPVYVVGQMQLGSGRGYVGAGPYVGYGFSAKTYPGGNLYSSDTHQRWDFGAGVMVGYEFCNRIAVNAGYRIGFIDALNAAKDDATMLPQSVSLGLAYRF